MNDKMKNFITFFMLNKLKSIKALNEYFKYIQI